MCSSDLMRALHCPSLRVTLCLNCAKYCQVCQAVGSKKVEGEGRRVSIVSSNVDGCHGHQERKNTTQIVGNYPTASCSKAE